MNLNHTPGRSWLARNWKLLLALVVIVPALLLGGLFTFVLRTMKSSEPYQTSFEIARRSPELIAAIGRPMQASFLVKGQIGWQNAGREGNVHLSYFLTGPEGTAKVMVFGSKYDGIWGYSELSATLQNDPAPPGPHNDLLPVLASHPAP